MCILNRPLLVGKNDVTEFLCCLFDSIYKKRDSRSELCGRGKIKLSTLDLLVFYDTHASFLPGAYFLPILVGYILPRYAFRFLF